MSAAADWISILHADLRELAALLLSKERNGHTLNPTALVHEAWLRMARQRENPWTTRAEFMPVAANVMRRVLIDHARKQNAARRPPLRLRLDFDEAHAAVPWDDLNLILSRLEDHDARLALVLQLRAFGGLSTEETALHLGVEPHEVIQDYQFAKAWLRRELRGT